MICHRPEPGKTEKSLTRSLNRTLLSSYNISIIENKKHHRSSGEYPTIFKKTISPQQKRPSI
jgi:hypothetical protein